jgi:hypothetical protein
LAKATDTYTVITVKDEQDQNSNGPRDWPIECSGGIQRSSHMTVSDLVVQICNNKLQF